MRKIEELENMFVALMEDVAAESPYIYVTYIKPIEEIKKLIEEIKNESRESQERV